MSNDDLSLNHRESRITPSQALSAADSESTSHTTRMTCDALCSLSSLEAQANNNIISNNNIAQMQDFAVLNERPTKRPSVGGCPKQHQLPMFLSKTYHMIDRCDPTVATWSPNGDSFVVKNVEKFASGVLPMYFKHSNFSSFARQLNFYGFRKLKAEPILTADFDARTACYVRFYHEKFQRNRPELLAHIKRATKSDQQSKDDVESLKAEINKLKECMTAMGSDYDRRMTEMSYEYNRRITALSAEYDRLAVLVQQVLANQSATASLVSPPGPATMGNSNVSDMMHSLSQVAAMSLQNSLRPPSLAAAASHANGAPNGHIQAQDHHQKRPSDFDFASHVASRARLS